MNRRHRLRGRGRFAAVRRSTAGARSGAVSVRAASNELECARAGFAVSGAHGAVERNRGRRRLRAALQPVLDEIRGVDVVVAAPAIATRGAFADLCGDVRRAAQQARERALA